MQESNQRKSTITSPKFAPHRFGQRCKTPLAAASSDFAEKVLEKVGHKNGIVDEEKFKAEFSANSDHALSFRALSG